METIYFCYLWNSSYECSTCWKSNKIDILEDKDKEIKSFKENMLKNKLGIDLSNNYIDNISSTQLTEER